MTNQNEILQKIDNMDMASFADDNTPFFLSLSLSLSLCIARCFLEKLKTTQLKYMNGFIKTFLNLALINAVLSRSLSLKKKFNLERLL